MRPDGLIMAGCLPGNMSILDVTGALHVGVAHESFTATG